MNNLDRNWNNLFGEYTTDETAWYGQWNSYSPEQELIKSKQAIRSFRSNIDHTAITHTTDGSLIFREGSQIAMKGGYKCRSESSITVKFFVGED
jgi:Domain of unknown function (DUF3598)